MKWDHIIRNGTIVGEDQLYPGDIYVKDGRIAAIVQLQILIKCRVCGVLSAFPPSL